ncbi:MAG: A24 family peptidase C-terminal domain-containing protein [Thermoplasmatota archaeon]
MVAAGKDLKTRQVPNELWIVMGSIASVILALDIFLRGAGWKYYLIFIPILVLFMEAFYERPLLYEDGKVNILVLGWLVLPLVTFFYQIFEIGDKTLFWSLATIPIMMLLIFLFYFFRLIYGGADAKALLVIAVLVPFYPRIEILNLFEMSAEVIQAMQLFFPFTLVILLNSSLILLILPLIYFFINLKNGDIGFPQMFFGYRKKVDEIPDSFVWPMEYYEGGEKRFQYMPRGDSEEDYRSLLEHDERIVWVTPKIPFLVPMCIGFLLSYVIGNPILLLF